MRRRQNDDDDNGFGEWGGYMAAKKSKLADQFNEAAKNEEKKESDLFKGISIFVNGYTNPSAEELKKIMMVNGGTFHHYHVTRPNGTTYIIASNLPDSKVKQLGVNTKILKPSWVTDSILNKKLLDYKPYLLYTNQKTSQPQLTFTKIANEITISNEIAGSTKSEQSRTRTAVDPNFLADFYNNSRLHLISTLGATFKQYINELRSKSSGEFSARDHIRNFVKNTNSNDLDYDKIIMHIDMDCFFVSVGLRSRPELRGLPVAVTHGRGNQMHSRNGVDKQAEIDIYQKRMKEKLSLKNPMGENGIEIQTRLDNIDNTSSMSEIASCSYEARRAGIKNGMFLGAALKLCPELKTMTYDFEAYKDVAYTLYNTIAKYTLDIEAVSCDEMYVDVTNLLKDTGATVEEWASFIRSEIQNKTDCPCSTGFGANRLQARLATRKAKPNGQFYLKSEEVQNYMQNISVDDLPGVGRSLSYKLHNLGFKLCKDLQSTSLNQLQTEFGNRVGEALHSHCRGIDDKPLSFGHIRKSVSAEVNYGIRFKNNTEAETFIKQLCEEVHSRLTEINMKGKCITLKLMVRAKDAPIETAKFMGHGVCDNVTKSSTLTSCTSDLTIITREILSILRKLSVNPSELRGIGIQISRLESSSKSVINNALTNFFQKAQTNTITQKNEPSKLKNTITLKKHNSENFLESEKRNTEKYALTNFFQKTDSTSIAKKNEMIVPTVPKNTTTLKKHNSENFTESETREEKNNMKNINKSSILDFMNQKNAFRRYKSAEDVENKNASISSTNSKTVNFEQNVSRPKQTLEIKSCEKRGRGRPKGSKTRTKNSTVNNGIVKYATATNSVFKKNLQINTKVDKEFLTALPEDIRAEVMEQLKISPNNHISNNIIETKETEVDADFLAALPEDIQAEVIEQYKHLKVSPTKQQIDNNNDRLQNMNGINKSVLAELPIEIQMEIINDLKNDGVKSTDIQPLDNVRENNSPELILNEVSTSNNENLVVNNNCRRTIMNSEMLERLEWEDMKGLFKKWFQIKEIPQICDIEIVATFARNLVLKKKIDKLIIFLKFLYRNISQLKNCAWHNGYKIITINVQENMKISYSGKLFINEEINCELCNQIT